MRFEFKVPNTLVLLFSLMIVALALTWVIPAGEFQTEINEAGREVVVPGTYTQNQEREYLSPLSVFTVIPRAMGQASDIIFFVLIIGGAIAVIRETGAIDALLGIVIRSFGHIPSLLIFFGMFAFAAASATLGMAEEYIPIALILVSVCAALRMDTVAAIGIMVVGYGIGYGVALINPFTLLIAQGVAGLQPGSGIEYRAAIALPFLLIGFHHVWRYAGKVMKNPEASLVHGIEGAQAPASTELPVMSRVHLIVLLATLAALTGLVIGIAVADWYLVELGAMFIALALIAGLVSGMGTGNTAAVFTRGAAELTGTALLIGFARSIALLLEDGEVLHTIVNALATPLSLAGAEMAAVGMLLIQSLLNFFIPSGSGQAFVTMPLMAPIGDIVGVSRQVAVLAFQFGDGFTNMIVPTNPVLMGILGLAGIPYDRWFRFIMPLILKLFAAGAVALVIAVWVGYQ
jgi:uncharacterized ion transporter superfamily protein YfcC